jgi:hypothetical protein
MSISRQWSRACVMATIALSSVAACSGSRPQPADTTSVAPAAGAAAGSVVSNEPVAKGSCPATGLWAECSAFQALDRAGLAPQRDSTAAPVHLDALSRAGARIMVGGAELDLFIYPNEAERARDEAHLDKHEFIEASDEPTLRSEPTLIRNSNLLAVLHSRNDHQRERVSDALSAGAPQPSRATLLPGSKAR